MCKDRITTFATHYKVALDVDQASNFEMKLLDGRKKKPDLKRM